MSKRGAEVLAAGRQSAPAGLRAGQCTRGQEHWRAVCCVRCAWCGAAKLCCVRHAPRARQGTLELLQGSPGNPDAGSTTPSALSLSLCMCACAPAFAPVGVLARGRPLACSRSHLAFTSLGAGRHPRDPRTEEAQGE